MCNMNERARIVAAGTGSLALEGLTPSPAVQRLREAWARGDASTEQLIEAERRLLAGESLEAAPPADAPAAPPRAT